MKKIGLLISLCLVVGMLAACGSDAPKEPVKHGDVMKHETNASKDGIHTHRKHGKAGKPMGMIGKVKKKERFKDGKVAKTHKMGHDRIGKKKKRMKNVEIQNQKPFDPSREPDRVPYVY